MQVLVYDLDQTLHRILIANEASPSSVKFAANSGIGPNANIFTFRSFDFQVCLVNLFVWCLGLYLSLWWEGELRVELGVR